MSFIHDHQISEIPGHDHLHNFDTRWGCDECSIILAATISIIDQHIPSLTDENEDEIIELSGKTDDFDAADLAIRTCRCGVRIDGFEEFAAHIKDELQKAGIV